MRYIILKSLMKSVEKISEGKYKIRSHKTGKLYPKVYGSKESAQERISQMEHFKKSDYKYVVIQKSDDRCPFDHKQGIRLRRYKQDHLWITEFRCPNGHIFQKES
jgi:ribosomal protein L14E/L6E/L27E